MGSVAQINPKVSAMSSNTNEVMHLTFPLKERYGLTGKGRRKGAGKRGGNAEKKADPPLSKQILAAEPFSAIVTSAQGSNETTGFPRSASGAAPLGYKAAPMPAEPSQTDRQRNPGGPHAGIAKQTASGNRTTPPDIRETTLTYRQGLLNGLSKARVMLYGIKHDNQGCLVRDSKGEVQRYIFGPDGGFSRAMLLAFSATARRLTKRNLTTQALYVNCDVGRGFRRAMEFMLDACKQDPLPAVHLDGLDAVDIIQLTTAAHCLGMDFELMKLRAQLADHISSRDPAGIVDLWAAARHAKSWLIVRAVQDHVQRSSPASVAVLCPLAAQQEDSQLVRYVRNVLWGAVNNDQYEIHDVEAMYSLMPDEAVTRRAITGLAQHLWKEAGSAAFTDSGLLAASPVLQRLVTEKLDSRSRGRGAGRGQRWKAAGEQFQRQQEVKYITVR